ncbi:MAG: hypothetical protein NTV01_09700 [Bacteroidia bacterium]|nr:hypothetical protein [Bacteroidia bacterium]
MRTKKSIIVLLLAVLVFPGYLFANRNTIPKPESIVNRYIKVAGGKKAFEAIQNRIGHSTMCVPIANLTAEIETVLAKPNRYLISGNMSMVGKFERGSNGEVVWESFPGRGTRVIESGERLRLLNLYNLDRLGNLVNLYQRFEFRGLDTINGQTVYKVVMITESGQSYLYYFNKKTGLIDQIDSDMETLAGKGVQQIFYSDYRKVNRVLIPHAQRIVEPSSESTLTFTSFEHNVKTDEGIFTFPKQLK